MGEPVITALTTDDLAQAVRDPTHDPLPLLILALNDPAANVREAAIRYLREMPSPRAVAGLSRRLGLGQAEAEEIRWQAAEALGIIGDPTAIPALLAAVTDRCPAVRLCVAEALGMIGRGDPRVAPALCRLAADPDSAVRVFALEAIGDLGDPFSLPTLRTRLPAEHGKPWVRVWIWYALARLGADPFPLPRALALLRNGGFGARVQAAQVLVRIAVPATQGRIRHALEAAAIRDEFLNRALDDLNTRFPDDETK